MRLSLITCIILCLPLLLTGQNVEDVFEIKFTSNSTQYRAALVLFDDGSGAMRVRFQDDGIQVVEQSITVDSTRAGKKLTGSNPVYPGTSLKFPSYDANEFLLSEDEKGNHSVKNLGSGGASEEPTIQKIEGDLELSHFLFFFNWKLGPDAAEEGFIPRAPVEESGDK